MAGFGSTLFGGLLAGEATLPTLNTIDVGTEQQKAIANNQAALPAAEALATGYNAFNQGQIETMLAKAIPGYADIKAQTSSNIEAMLKGEVPTSDAAAQQLKSVSQAFNLGTTSSSATGSLVARDLGLSQLSLMDKGLSSAESWMSTMNQIEGQGMFNVSSMFVTPQQQLASDTSERNVAYEAQYMQNMMDWQSSAGYLAGSDISSTADSVVSICGSSAGSGGSSGGGSISGTGGVGGMSGAMTGASIGAV